jgi:hypothetical protein
VLSDVSFCFLRPSEPEYTQVRLSHLQYILATSKETNEGTLLASRAMLHGQTVDCPFVVSHVSINY